MPAGSPLISAIIPAFNAERYIGDAVESVLEQTYPAVECIVIDDGSYDGTATMVERYGDQVRYERQRNKGVSAARNRGAALARGELLAFLDADDVWLPARLSRLAGKLDEEIARVGLCAANLVDRDLAPNGILRMDHAPSAETMLLHQGSLVSCSSNLLIARDYFESVGGFDERLSMSADWDLLLRLVEDGPVAYVDEALVLYRRHGANMSHDIGAMEQDMLLAYEKAFERGPQLDPIRRRAYGALHWMLAGSYLDSGERFAGVRHLSKALAFRPALALRLGRALSHPGALKPRSTVSATEPSTAGSAVRAFTYGLADIATLRRGIPRSINGQSIRFPPRWARYYPGDYQADTHAFVSTHSRKGTRAIDVGAHLGVFSVAMARAVAPGGRVLSFEPTPDTREALSRIVRCNGLTSVVEVRSEAVEAEVGTRELHVVPVAVSNANSLVPEPRATETIRVRAVSIDSVVAAEELPVSCIKIDAEGSELEVLEGARQTIERFDPAIALDVHPEGLSLAGHGLGDVWARIDDMGYQVLVAGERRLGEDEFLRHQGPFAVHLIRA